ncbi:MAG TPA: helix-turn-helix transcriptional regulator [Acidobacteriaceae bacterium]|jgi:DNA-binding transcriptional ArsR family regulator|nr:helix-turn-helix transcriptional regulator [Acidobacteriaceae bacterium]
MDAERDVDGEVSRIAAAIGEPARTRMLYCLMEGQARTSTELAMVAGVTASTASVHLNRLKDDELVRVLVQGRHRYYSLASPAVARALEGLSVLAGGARSRFAPKTPVHLRAARTCYDHMAGAVAVGLHDRLAAARWIRNMRGSDGYLVTAEGVKALAGLGLDVEAARGQRRKFAFACLDWSERRPHVGGALGAALLGLALRKQWVARELDSRALRVTRLGRRELQARFGLEV